jgi:pimeloyl-ACP methyl ester carboxylesterase
MSRQEFRMTADAAAQPPPLLLTLAEGRAVFELGWFAALRRALRRLPKGDGHPVLVLPGFLASDVSTRPMRGLLRDLGYDARGWGLGQNVKFNPEREGAIQRALTDLHAQARRKVSIVGWSLGGVFARELAKIHPDKVRGVISLGSPISGEPRHSRARDLFEAVNGKQPDAQLDGRYARLAEAPPVPTTSILTKTDGIVAWQGSVQKPGPQTENIVVPASHVGIGVNPLAMVAIADRLAQEEGAWKPFDRSGWRAMFYGTA